MPSRSGACTTDRSDAEKKDSHAVAAKVIDIIAAAVDPLLALKEGLRKAGVNEFIGIVERY